MVVVVLLTIFFMSWQKKKSSPEPCTESQDRIATYPHMLGIRSIRIIIIISQTGRVHGGGGVRENNSRAAPPPKGKKKLPSLTSPGGERPMEPHFRKSEWLPYPPIAGDHDGILRSLYTYFKPVCLTAVPENPGISPPSFDS